MKRLSKYSAIVLSVSLLAVGACKRDGDAERAGEKVDRAVENVKDTVNPKGTVEKAGEKIDETVENVKDAVNPDGPTEEAGEKIDEAVSGQ